MEIRLGVSWAHLQNSDISALCSLLNDMLKSWVNVCLLVLCPYSFVRFQVQSSHFYVYLGLLPSCYCVCFCHHVCNKWCYNQVLCYQFLFLGQHLKWNTGGVNLSRTIGEKWNGGDTTCTIVWCNSVVIMNSRVSQGWMDHFHRLTVQSIGTGGG